MQNEIPAAIFRAYDIRGIAGESLTSETVYTIARAIGSEALARHQHTLIVGRDGRLSSPILFEALCKGLLDSGCNLVDIGMVATPLLYFAIHHLDISSGVMLTGSHNAANYNGLKMLLGGQRLTAEEIQALHQRILADDYPLGAKPGNRQTQDIVSAYIQAVTQSVQLARPLKIVIDCGNGVAGGIAPKLFHQLGCEVIELFCDVDGHFPNHHPDPTIVENLVDLQEAVIQYKADIGLAFDGDSDRLGVVTNSGQIIWPDRQMMLFANDLLKKQPGISVVFDVKCSNQLGKLIAAQGGRPELWKTGHSLIKKRMLEVGAMLGGEMSGHIFFADRWFGFDDGMYVGARLLEILASSNQTVDELFEMFPNTVNTPELKIAVPEAEKFVLMSALIDSVKDAPDFKTGMINLMDGLRVEFPNGWGLIRASNTSPCLTVRFEADDDAELKAIQARFRHLLQGVAPNLELPF